MFTHGKWGMLCAELWTPRSINNGSIYRRINSVCLGLFIFVAAGATDDVYANWSDKLDKCLLVRKTIQMSINPISYTKVTRERNERPLPVIVVARCHARCRFRRGLIRRRRKIDALQTRKRWLRRGEIAVYRSPTDILVVANVPRRKMKQDGNRLDLLLMAEARV